MARPYQGYKNSAGDRVPGTTTIIGRFKESGGLLQWAFRQGQSGAESLYEERDKAAEAGTIAHDMIECDILGKEFSPPIGAPADLVAKANNAFLQFREWRAQSRIEIIATETPLLSEEHQFGGCIDGIGKMPNDDIVLIDWKTSNAVYSDYLLQLAAYGLLLKECKPEWAPKGYHLLRVSKEAADFAHHYYGELSEAESLFLLYRKAYDLDKLLAKRAK